MSRFSKPVRFSSTAAYWPARPMRPRSALASRLHVQAGDARGARVGLEQGGEDADGGRLARRRWAEQAQHGSGLGAQVHAAEGVHLAVGLLQPLRDDRWVRHEGRTVAKACRARGTVWHTLWVPVRTSAALALVVLVARIGRHVRARAEHGEGLRDRRGDHRRPRPRGACARVRRRLRVQQRHLRHARRDRARRRVRVRRDRRSSSLSAEATGGGRRPRAASAAWSPPRSSSARR